jgi:acetyl-CoA/propionyl-CoA carboxylase biotin carboxyl carrier protein
VFKRILVANRGEIALRIIRACRELDVATVAVYSDADRDALHVQLADDAYHIGPSAATQSYLNVEKLLAVAARSRCDAVHPGYGFLAENASFAAACAAHGLTFIGPSVAAMARMGDKLAARETARAANVPLVEGSTAEVTDPAAVLEIAERIGYPVAIKASAGGGGKGLKVARTPSDVASAWSLARKEAAAYFGDGRVYLERYLARPKHVEVQVLCDRYGAAVHLGERDCSLQRRHQKLIEESPACIAPGLRERMHAAALSLARSIGYDSVGTIECLVDDDRFYFLEMNTRIQVEHTVSEMVYGFDLVKAQIRVAAGEPLWCSQDDLQPRGHAIECRLNAEAPGRDFAPAPGRIVRYVEPGGPGIRVDGAAFAGWEIGADYDSLIAKLVAWGADREEARTRMLRALREYLVDGVETTIPLYQLLIADPAFRSGEYTTATVAEFLEHHAAALREPESAGAGPSASSPSAGGVQTLTVEVEGKRFTVTVAGLQSRAPAAPGASGRVAPMQGAPRAEGGHQGHLAVTSPMHGIVAELRVKPGDAVVPGQVVAVIEAMKMMNEVTARAPGVVLSVAAQVGQTVERGTTLVTLGDGSRPHHPPDGAHRSPNAVPGESTGFEQNRQDRRAAP